MAPRIAARGRHSSSAGPVLIQDASSVTPGPPSVLVSTGALRMARAEADVRTVVYVVRGERLMRSYRPSGADYQRTLDASIVDWRTKTIVATREFVGSAPDDRSGSPAGYDSTRRIRSLARPAAMDRGSREQIVVQSVWNKCPTGLKWVNARSRGRRAANREPNRRPLLLEALPLTS